MRNGTFYLNNSGSRWVVYVNGKKPRHVFQTKSGNQVERTAMYYFSFGNFAGAAISYKGKIEKVLLDAILQD